MFIKFSVCKSYNVQKLYFFILHKKPHTKVGYFSKIAEILNLKFCFIKIAHRTTYILWIWCIQFFGGEVNEAMKGTSFRGGILVMNSVSFLPWVCWSRLMQSRLSSFKLKLTNIQIGETQLETHHLTSNPVL